MTTTEAPPLHVIHEQSVLACVLMDESTYDEMGVLLPSHFDLEIHAVLWQTLSALRGEGLPVTVATVQTFLGVRLASNPSLLATMHDYVPGVMGTYAVPVGAEYHAQKVREYARLRWAHEKALRVVALAEAGDLRGLAEAEELAGGVAAGAEGLKPRSNAAVVSATLDHLEARATEKEKPAMETGIAMLDGINAFARKRVVAIGARPGVGKSLLGYQIAQHAASKGRAGLFVSLEMDGEELMLRQFSQESLIAPRMLNLPQLMTHEWDALTNTARSISPRRLDMLDSGELTLETVLAAARRLKVTQGLDFLVLDYLQLLPMPNAERVRPHEALAAITRKLKAASRSLDICMVALSQLNRPGEGASPRLTNFSGSDTIGHDCDTALALWPNEDKGGDGWKEGKRYLVLDVVKNRHGPTKSADLMFNPSTLILTELVRQ